MSDIVYTTSIKRETVEAYQRYQEAKEKFPSGDVRRNIYWIQFCNACEKENKQPLAVAETLNK